MWVGAQGAVREHPAPSGALRRAGWNGPRRIRKTVREHPAPSGALRLCSDAPSEPLRPESGSTQHHQVH